MYFRGTASARAEENPANNAARTAYLRELEPWIGTAAAEVRYIDTGTSANPDMAVFGLGQSGHWYMQAHDTAFCAFAVLGTDPLTDESRAGMSRQEMKDTALAMLRYTLRTHKSGQYNCGDGKKWGHSTFAQLGLERMTAGIDALEDDLDDELKELLRNVYASEADYLLDLPVTAGLTPQEGNVPEVNTWRGSTLWKAAALWPENPHADQWREKAITLLLNSISIPSDKQSEVVVDGKEVKERFAGPNFFESYGCNHHGYQNIGYMNIVLSNRALLYFWCKKRGCPIPEAFYHHLFDLWRIVKSCLFDDGRLLRVGGDTRVAYTYCQDYAIFAWLLAADTFADRDTSGYELGWLEQVHSEHQENPDGWFMKKRLERLWELSPMYFQRLEGDKACTLATAAYWHRVFDLSTSPARQDPPQILPSWYDEYHGTWLVRGTNRVASWTWRAAERPTGVCVPADSSDMADWQGNLSAMVQGTGLIQAMKPTLWTGEGFDGGFVTCGRCEARSGAPLAEGDHADFVGAVWQLFCALPDDNTVVVLQYAKALLPCYVTDLSALNLRLPNGPFNGHQRIFYTENNQAIISETYTSQPVGETLAENSANWINIDDKLGVTAIYGGSPALSRSPKQETYMLKGDKTLLPGGFLYCDIIAQKRFFQPTLQEENCEMFDCGAVIRTETSEQTRKGSLGAAKRLEVDTVARIRAVEVLGADGKTYLITANFTKDPQRFSLPADGRAAIRLATGERVTDTLTLQPAEAAVFVVGE